MPRRFLSLATLLALTTACQSRLTGNEGNFEFSYWTDDDVVDFNKPIAVGARLDIEVRDVAQHQPVDLTAATTDDEAVLTVALFETYVVTVEGIGDGSALLEVEGTTASGEALSDSVNLLARTPEVLNLWHTCTGTDGQAAYLTGQQAYVPFDMQMTNGQPVIGYGYYPVTVSGDGAALDTSQSDQTWMLFETTVPGTLLLESDIDDAALTMNVVEAASIDGIEEPIAFVLEDIDVGDTNAFYVRPMVGSDVVCQGDTEKTVQSDTPEICDVREASAASDSVKEYGWFEIEGVSAGDCLYTVTFTEAGSGAGVSQQFSYEIQP